MKMMTDKDIIDTFDEYRHCKGGVFDFGLFGRDVEAKVLRLQAEQTPEKLREAVAEEIHLSQYAHRQPPWELSWENEKPMYKDACYRLADQILTLFAAREQEADEAAFRKGFEFAQTTDDVQEAVKKERERILKWGIEICHEHLPKWDGNVDLMGGVLSRRECPKCWQAQQDGTT